MLTSASPDSDALIGFFMEHVVPVLFEFERDDKVSHMIVTSTVIAVEGQWFLLTAGHCIADVQSYREEHGYNLSACQLVDYCGARARFLAPIPFAYDRSHPGYSGRRPPDDYGIIPLSQLYREQLEKNGIRALNEEAWRQPPDSAESYVLLGVADEMTREYDAGCSFRPTWHRVQALKKRPSLFQETGQPMFYGRITLPAGMTDIKGLSGGPILAFDRDPQGNGRYWLVAVQSTWGRQSQCISACRVVRVAELIGQYLRQGRGSSA